MAFQPGVIEAIQDWGLRVIEHDGWRTRGSSVFDPRGHLLHHDVFGHTNTLPGSMITGRPDLAGPLCNFWLTRLGVVHMVAAGEANHAGSGGFQGLSGNASVWGTEMNNLGFPTDPWPDEQLEAMSRLAAATAQFSGFDASMVCAHREWTTRKPDPHTINMPNFRKRVGTQTKEQFSIVDKETKKYFDEKFANIRDRERSLRETQLNHGKRLREIRVAQGASKADLKDLDDDLALIARSLKDDR